MEKAKIFGDLKAEAARCFRSPLLRQVLCWCLPALALGLLLRGILVARMPNAFYHGDSYTVFETYNSLATNGVFEINPKKTALTPLLYGALLFAHVPVLPAVAILQHTLGLVLIVFVGLLVAHSYHRWRLFIIPVTILTAIDPVLLWYEHLCLPEFLYVFLVTATALTGLLVYRNPTPLTRSAFVACLFLTAAARPEGKLWCLFGTVLLARGYWPDKRRCGFAVMGMLLFTVVCFVLNRTYQGGSLLYSNVAQLTPKHLRSAPGFAESNKAYFDELRARWKVVPTKIPHERKAIVELVRSYLRQKHAPARLREVDALCSKMAAESCSRGWASVPALALVKFRYGLQDPVAEDFGPVLLYHKQYNSFLGRGDDSDDEIDEASTARVFTKLVLRKDLHSKAELTAYLHQAYHPFDPDWLSQYCADFQRLAAAFRLPDRPLEDSAPIPGIPALFIAATAGVLALALRERRAANYYYLWLGAILFMVFILALTGSNRGRFRVFLEPFLFLYAIALVDVAIDLVSGIFCRMARRRPLERSEG